MTDTQINRWSPYAVDGGCDAYGEMEEDEVGDYVNYEDHAAHIDAQDAKIKALVEALERSNVAIEDWLAQYAGEFCDETHVKDAEQRISDAGGTLSYIASVTAANRAALAAAKETT